jgi:hypothetical protein
MKTPCTLPRRREKGLLLEELPTETLVYDTTSDKAHCLNAVARLVWKHCDGPTTVTEMVEILRKDLDIPADEAVVQLTLEKLAKAGLLETEEHTWFENSTSRRQAAKTLAKFSIAAAMALVTTIAAPTVAEAQSTGGPCKNNQGCTTNNCCKNVAGSPGNTPGCGTCRPTNAHCPNGNC